jgi:TolB-like protein
MTCSTSCSSSAVRAIAIGLAIALCACTGPGRSAAGRQPVSRIAIFPIDNRSGDPVALGPLLDAIELALARRGFEVVSGAAVDEFLARHRIRYTGAVDPPGARAARDELKVGGVLVTTIERYLPGPPPRVAITMRLVSATDEPAILWIDGIGRTGDESPGLLGLGRIDSVKKLEREILDDLARSLRSTVRDDGPRTNRCETKRIFTPHVRRAPSSPRALSADRRASVSEPDAAGVCGRARGAGRGARPLAIDRFRVLEPGVVRDLALRFRLILEGGVTVQQARTMLGALEVDVVVTGEVFEYVDGGSAGSTKASFSITAMDGRTGKVVWQSISYNRGDDARTVFDFGDVATVQELRCVMIRTVVDGMAKRPRGTSG